MAKKKEKPRKYSVLFGFRGHDDPDVTAFVKAGGGVTSDIGKAMLFERENYSGSDKWASPSEWAKFFNEDPQYSPWIFHSIGTTRRKQ